MSIHEYCATGNLQGMQNLIAEGIDIDQKDTFGWAPIHYVSASILDLNRKEIVDELIRHGCNLNGINSFGETALHEVSNGGHLRLVKELLKHEVDCNIQNLMGDTPLHLATRRQEVGIIKELIDYTDLSIKNKEGQTAFELATIDVIREIFIQAECSMIKEPAEL